MTADSTSTERLIKTARGQLDGVMKMIEEDRYCMDILNQLLATQRILEKAQREILTSHLECCVREAFTSGREKEKIAEIVALLERMN